MHQASMMSVDKSSEKIPGSKQLSTSLKERLKKCGRYHSSPVAVPASKRPCFSSPYSAKCQQQGSNSFQCNSAISGGDSHADSGIFSPGVTNSSSTKCSTPDFMSGADKILHTGTPVLPSKSESSSNKILHTGTPVLPSKCVNRSGLRSKPSRLQFSNQNNSDSELDKSNQNPAFKSKLSHVDDTGNINNVSESAGQTFKTDYNDGCLIKENIEKLSEISNSCKIELASSSRRLQDHDCAALIEERNRLKILLEKKEEELRKLNMVKMYRTKNDLNQLRSLIKKWRDVSQQALTDLLEKMPEPKPTLTQLIDHLHIDHAVVKFDAEEEMFN